MQTKFESFYWQLLQHTKHLSQQEQYQLKSKSRTTCENYARIKTPCKYKKIIENLSNNKNTIVLKQDKGRGVTILNRKSYIEKCKTFAKGKFHKLETDPTKTIQGNYNKCLEVLRMYLPKVNTNDNIPLAQNPVHSMEMLRYIS